MQDTRISAGRFAPGEAPKVTPDMVQKEIFDCEFIVRQPLTICILTLRNGTKITGESACVYPENFNPEKGMEIARLKAEAKIYALEGYLLAQKRFEEDLRYAGN
jgi:hypothetical protein